MQAKPAEKPNGSRAPLICLVSVVTMSLLGALSSIAGWPSLAILFLISQAVVISLVIWQACDPFADAAQWIGIKFRIPGSVRGATLDAIASSMPELFTGIFFVVLAVMHSNRSVDLISETSGEGYGATVATCAGSAVYNMILIPALCALYISYHRKERPTIDVESRVLSRDGVWFLYCEIILITFLFQPALHWWMAGVLIGLYVVYCLILYQDTQKHRQQLGNRQEQSLPENAHALFGSLTIPLTQRSAWATIAVATCIAAIACYWLVNVTNAAADILKVPVFFVAMIIAAAASSVPDTFLSIGAAKHGDDDGAVSNAFGSNIFDICICLTIPLLVASYLNDWGPVCLTHNGEALPGVTELRLLLCILSFGTLAIMWHKKQLTRTKAYVLFGMYGIFVAYAIAGSLGFGLRSFIA